MSPRKFSYSLINKKVLQRQLSTTVRYSKVLYKTHTLSTNLVSSSLLLSTSVLDKRPSSGTNGKGFKVDDATGCAFLSIVLSSNISWHFFPNGSWKTSSTWWKDIDRGHQLIKLSRWSRGVELILSCVSWQQCVSFIENFSYIAYCNFGILYISKRWTLTKISLYLVIFKTTFYKMPKQLRNCLIFLSIS